MVALLVTVTVGAVCVDSSCRRLFSCRQVPILERPALPMSATYVVDEYYWGQQQQEAEMD